MNGTIRKPSSAWRISLRELLMIFAFVALACAAMVHPSKNWVSILTALVIVTGGYAAMRACIERGQRQAFGFGFCIVMALYLIGTKFTPSPTPIESNKTILRMDGNTSLPTSRLLAYLWQHTRRPYYYAIYSLGASTGVPLEAYEAEAGEESMPNRGDPFGKPAKPPSGYGEPGGPVHYYVGMYPDFKTTLGVGHQLFAILLAYLGGKLAVWIYLRRLAREDLAREAKEQP